MSIKPSAVATSSASIPFARTALCAVLAAMTAAVAAQSQRPRITGGPQPALRVTDAQSLASGPTPFAAGCDGVTPNGTLYVNAEVEPFVTVNPANANILVGAWQQDRWSNGAARGLVAATSFDGGRSWRRAVLPFSRCGGGSVMNGGNYDRASDPWVSYSPNGVVHAMSLSVSGAYSAMLASRSFDHGLTWSNPITLIADGPGAFNDKNALTADPHDANYVYAVWDRLVDANSTGPAIFTRSTNGGASWEGARAIFDPGSRAQTIANQVAVLPNGVLLNLFTQINYPIGEPQTARIGVLRSLDRGATWSGPIYIADLLAVGTRHPETGAAIRDGSIVPSITTAPNGDAYVVWQDSRFSGGAIDAVAISRSSNGGTSWSTPTRVNAAPSVAAFTPSVHVTRDGVLGVSYYDFRSNTVATGLPTDYWLARSFDHGATWTEARVAEPFEMTLAPVANGMFVGDYQGLTSVAGRFLPFYGRTSAGDAANRTDIVAAPFVDQGFPSAATSLASQRAELRSRHVPRHFRVTPLVRQRVSDNLQRRLKQPPGFRSGWIMPNVMRALQL
ncbi:MAG: exo-alpha-sialidase [Xanthomonadaceae bacterium]|nr:exo-alpha-sialidase [Xanthomonadaceae bacterium]